MSWVDYVIIAALAVGVLGIIAYLIKEKRQGKSGCGCGCSGCPHANACGGVKAEKPEKTPGGGPTDENNGNN